MYAGAASGAVTIGLALFLVLMSQKPNASETQKQPPPELPPVEKTAVEQPSSQAAVVLPPPPARALPPAPAIAKESPAQPAMATHQPPLHRPTLKPRDTVPPPKTVEVTPLQPRREPAPPKVAPSRMPKPAPVPQDTPPKQVAKLPSAETIPPTSEQTTPVTVTRKTVKEGRALLKMLEIGKGPVIEIAWPRDPSDRSRLYNLLTACHGMQTAMLAGKSNIYAIDGAPGATWNINRDAVSGFIRRPAGALTDAEKSAIKRIKARHGILYATPVRVFPRGVDATMLGGLGGIVGPGYLKYKTIRARYQLTGNRIAVIDVRADGKPLPGGVAFPRTRRCS